MFWLGPLFGAIAAALVWRLFAGAAVAPASKKSSRTKAAAAGKTAAGKTKQGAAKATKQS